MGKNPWGFESLRPHHTMYIADPHVHAQDRLALSCSPLVCIPGPSFGAVLLPLCESCQRWEFVPLDPGIGRFRGRS